MDNKAPSEKTNPEADAPQLSPEVLDRIKHPPNIEDVLREQSPEERNKNQAIVPETLDGPSQWNDSDD
jgi:hypothetical protein